MSISLEEALKHYEEALDADTIRGIHADCRGVRSEVCEQLSMLTGLGAPPASGSAREGVASPNSMGERTMTQESQGMGGPSYTSASLGGGFLDEDAYEDAVATGEEKAKMERDKELNELMKKKVEDVAKLFENDREFDKKVAAQRALGPQSMRGKKLNLKQFGDDHAHSCFAEMIAREEDHCGEFVCFYHSYSFSALLYEIQACVGRILYGLPIDFAPAARLLKAPFRTRPHMKLLLENFSSLQGQDHDPSFRAVAISCSVSLESNASEAPPMSSFTQGYSCTDLSFHDIMKKIFQDIGYNGSDLSDVINKCAAIGERHQLHGSSYKNTGQTGASHSVSNPGHMLQIFIRTDCVDDVAYGSQAYGVFAQNLNPPSEYLTKKGSAPNGQARIFWHPSLFLDQTKTRVYHYAANKGAHGSNRVGLQLELEQALKPILGTPEKALRAYRGVEGLLKDS